MTDLNAECEKAWAAYRIAHNQAMSNGAALQEAQAEVLALSAHVAELEGERQRISQWCDERFNCGSTEALDHISAILRASLTKEAVVDG